MKLKRIAGIFSLAIMAVTFTPCTNALAASHTHHYTQHQIVVSTILGYTSVCHEMKCDQCSDYQVIEQRKGWFQGPFRCPKCP
ncbi:hypothetical protein psyc5s11_32710 [Clostridium gelidum]|uniref:Uncharacterized protein n=1 Tax=Clostridium gelidum TaxID=704125 RepID=A0ABN6J3I6_9CLOT|nr:hypothetical protein [Clostridium gelidum]BCZ47204.1 hypothetical protein psyc5s11_32710 [Clostridium gelidum]